ncbi:glycosyltransferase involved in cell wall biosynthesis [Sphingobium sp. B1D7B]|uniref:glycosyltransferase n=1 Tax=unclassified Sphingobium TaxID=2611147 RepID=UPI0022257510|nr:MULTISPECIES: glycosyltransferase [unclassified Sphingobium]MCW2392414.1 glycosyltransferase involved in cell wall biosynthesis [Sphingobium sp. B11D3A]MCW2404109.1 glycosyltransferase involved in cell wall biosynthesis [Sphingobium sp. B1D7B]
MKLIIQIPCYNEAEHLPATLLSIPRQITGVDCIELLIIDDGSHDNTSDIALRFGVHHIVKHRTNRGLAAAFQTGLNAALKAGADIIVNTDADGQYESNDIAALVEPILKGQADITIGDRGVANNAHFSLVKRHLQKLGSAVVQRLARTHIPDAVSGFRALSREAAQRIAITSEFSYTTDMLIQAGRKRLGIVSVPVQTNRTLRPSRLFRNIPQFIVSTGTTMVRAYTMYNPLRVFLIAGVACAVIGALPIVRFLYFALIGETAGHIQSLILGGALLVLGVVAGMLGVLADLIAGNRKLLEMTLEHVRRLEHQFGTNSSSANPSSLQGDEKYTVGWPRKRRL